MASILVVDDEQSIREFFQILLQKQGWDVTCVASGEEALDALERGIFDLVITDIAMPGISGTELLNRINEMRLETGVILITAYGDTESAVTAMKQGAVDYLLKPFKVDEIKIVIQQALERSALYRENRLLRRELRDRLGFGQLVGKSPTMLKVFKTIQQLAKNRSNVLISGDSGTGKELVARAIHEQSPQSQQPFISVNCGAIPETLIESELFGYMKGAFTGATLNKRGLMEVAGEGSFFFDEIGELPLQTQVKLLRVLQDRVIRRIGGTNDIPLGCRIIAATNKDLQQQVKRGKFREDLYYRLNVFSVSMQPLRERQEDIPLLVQHFVDKYVLEHDKKVKGFTAAAMERFVAYLYPGNVRELGNLVEQAIAMCSQDIPWIGVEELPPVLQQQELVKPVATKSHDYNKRLNRRLRNGGVALDEELAELERRLILEALEVSGGVKKKAAKLLDISFRSMRYRLLKLGIYPREDP